MGFICDLLHTVTVTPVGTDTAGYGTEMGSDWLWLTPDIEVGQVISQKDKRDEL